ncbi:MAG: 50S ribosomal protein L21 [Patescibacteria group bacterium]|nr:50S ribosomal protein L21 [Patescibacteria group bacterium]
MKDFAIIHTGGKQYRVSAGDKLKIEKLAAENGSVVLFDEVLLRSENGSVKVGTPNVTGAKVEARVLRGAKDRTKIVFKYHSKARYKKKKGHRQPFTEIEIVKI